MKNIIVRKKIWSRKRKIRHKDWWNMECTKMKREVKRMYKKWRKGKIEGGRYMVKNVK